MAGTTSRIPLGNHRNRGFSLIEMMVVVVLVSILSALIVPAMRGTYKHEVLRSTSRDILMTLRLAHTQAVTKGTRHWFKLNQNLGEFKLEKLEKNPDSGRYAMIPVQGVHGAEGDIPESLAVTIEKALTTSPDPSGMNSLGIGMNMDNPDAESSSFGVNDGICFYPDGTSESKSVIISDEDGFILHIVINPLTSRVSLKKGAPSPF